LPSFTVHKHGVEAVEAVQNNRQLEFKALLYAVLAEFEAN
jgi:hypothetical protein